jgi:hypothetical protein
MTLLPEEARSAQRPGYAQILLVFVSLKLVYVLCQLREMNFKILLISLLLEIGNAR